MGARQSSIVRTAATVLAAGACCLAAGCRRAPDALTVAGSTSFQSVERSWADAFSKASGGAPIHIENVDSAAAIHAVRSGFAGVGVAEFVTPPIETESLRVTPVARDGIAVIVHAGHAVTNLTREQVRGIFSGTVTRWEAVGGGTGAIHCVMRERGSGTRRCVEELLSADGGSVNGVILETSRAILETVARDPNAVGYVSHAVVDDRVREVPVDGTACSAASIADGTYPLVRTLNLVSAKPPADRAKAFIDFALSPEGREIARRAELIPLP